MAPAPIKLTLFNVPQNKLLTFPTANLQNQPDAAGVSIRVVQISSGQASTW